MKLIDLTCPHCSARLKVDSEQKQAICEYCGATVLIDDEVQHVQYDNAEEAGYNFEKGRQRALAEASKERQQAQVEANRERQAAQAEARRKQQRAQAEEDRERQQAEQAAIEEKMKKRKTWLWVLGWICMFPVPLTILLLRRKGGKPALKYGIILVSWIVYILIGVFGSRDDSKTDQTKEQQETMVTDSNTKSTESGSDKSKTTVEEYDDLQKIFLAISKDTTAENLESLISKYGVACTVKHYNGTPKSTNYKLAYTDEVALQSYADEGDNIEVSFSEEDGSLLYAEYNNSDAFMCALLYSYGIYWDLQESEKENTYTGYYYYEPGNTEGGITIEYRNGNSTETGYHSCASAEEALQSIVGR